MHVLKQSVPNWKQRADFSREFLKIKNDRGKIAAKGENQAGFQRISMVCNDIAWSVPIPAGSPSRRISMAFNNIAWSVPIRQIVKCVGRPGWLMLYFLYSKRSTRISVVITNIPITELLVLP